MSQPMSVSITMDAASFHKFRSFDLFRHQKRWRRPLAFTAILLVFSCICLSQVGVREGAALLAVVLAVVALGLPAVYFYTFFRDLRTTIKKLGLHIAYRTPDAVYLYVQQNQAYLVNDSQDAVWAFLSSALPAARLRDLR